MGPVLIWVDFAFPLDSRPAFAGVTILRGNDGALAIRNAGGAKLLRFTRLEWKAGYALWEYVVGRCPYFKITVVLLAVLLYGLR